MVIFSRFALAISVCSGLGGASLLAASDFDSTKSRGACLRWLTKAAETTNARVFWGQAQAREAYVIHVRSSGVFGFDDPRIAASFKPVRAVLEGSLIDGDSEEGLERISSYLRLLQYRGEIFGMIGPGAESEAYGIIGHVASLKKKGHLRQWLVFQNREAFEKFRDLTMSGIESLDLFEDHFYTLKLVEDRP